MAILGKDLFEVNLNPFRFTVKIAKNTVSIGKTMMPLGTVCAELLNIDISEAVSAIDTFLALDDSGDIAAAKEQLKKTNSILFELPPMKYFRCDVDELLLDNIDYYPLSEDDMLWINTFGEPSTADKKREECHDRYARFMDDLLVFKNRYPWILREIEHDLDNCGNDYAKAIERAGVSPFFSGASLGERHNVDPAEYNVRYEVIDGVMFEVIIFENLLDFLYVDFCKFISAKNIFKRCRLCGKLFVLEPGYPYEYCNEPSPDDPDSTCREIGSQTCFANKVHTNPFWEIYERAYKKYYARVMKKKWTRTQFAEWQACAMKLRDDILNGETQMEPEEFGKRINRL